LRGKVQITRPCGFCICSTSPQGHGTTRKIFWNIAKFSVKFSAEFFSFVGWFVRSFVGSLVRWFVGSLVRWFVGSLVRWFVGWLVGSLVGSLVRWFVGSLVGWFVRWLVRWLVGWLVGWFVRSFVRSVVSTLTCRFTFIYRFFGPLKGLPLNAFENYSCFSATFQLLFSYFSLIPCGYF